MTENELRELSEKADLCELEVGEYEGFDHVIYQNDDGSVTGVCRCDNDPRMSDFRNPDTAAFIVALVNAYREGHLVWRGEKE